MFVTALAGEIARLTVSVRLPSQLSRGARHALAPVPRASIDQDAEPSVA